jgi:hypothetical protein
MFYELLRLRKNISRPQLDSERIEVAHSNSSKKPNNLLVIKGDYTTNSRNPTTTGIKGGGLSHNYLTFQKRLS